MPGVGVHYWNDARGKPGGVAGLDFGAQIPRNLFVNGGFTVRQRGGVIAGTSGFVCDRWWANTNSGGCSVQSVAPFLSNSWSAAFLSISPTLAGNTATIRYAGIESVDSIKLQNQTLTLAVSYISQLQGVSTFTAKVVMGTGTDQNFTTTGSYATGNSVLVTMSVDTTHPGAQLTQSVSFNTPGNLSEISVEFDFVCVSTGFVDIFNLLGVSLAQGNVAIPYNVYSFQMELAACQRYYYQSFTSPASAVAGSVGSVGVTTQGILGLRFPVAMRATPVLVLSFNGVANRLRDTTTAAVITIVTPSVVSMNLFGFSHYFDAGSAPIVVGRPYDFDVTANAEL